MKRVLLAFTVSSLLLAACGVALLADKDAADVVGTWEMLSKGPQGDFTGDLVLQQNGNSIHGTVETNFGDGQVEGKVKGDLIQFDASLAMEVGSIDVNYSGTVSGDRMKGTYKAADTAGTWTAVRLRPGQ
ncbi:MAG TPA: hypothetical protein VEH50_02580 [Methylomirabilota bacterium]|nr:hypothetical protein [Methylomirabilota bacterium]